MLIGYARTSTLEQVAGFEAQLRDLKAIGCDRIYQEQVSAVAQRQELLAAIDYARDGDTLVVTKLDRLARSITHLWQIIERLEKKKVAVRILNLGIDTASPTGKLILTVMGGIAQFEREMIMERQKEGILKAKAEGKYKGNPTARRHLQTIIAMRADNKSAAEIATTLKISIPSVYRLLADATLPAHTV